MILYKYLAAESNGINLIGKILGDGLLRFTQMSALNDPFETAPSTIQYRIHQQIKQTPGQRKRFATEVNGPAEVADAILDLQINEFWPQQAREFIDNTHVFLSLTERPDNLLMWAHYAASHQGFVIGFDSDTPLFRPRAMDGVYGLDRVIYSPLRYALPVDGFGELGEKETAEAISSMLLTKSQDWRYEEEWRVIEHPKRADETKQVPNSFDICLFRFPPEAVRKVIIGSRTLRKNQSKIAEAIKRYPNVSLLKAHLDDIEFKIRVAPINEEEWEEAQG